MNLPAIRREPMRDGDAQFRAIRELMRQLHRSLPKVLSPISLARSRSWSAPATISDALAEPSFTSTTSEMLCRHLLAQSESLAISILILFANDDAAIQEDVGYLDRPAAKSRQGYRASQKSIPWAFGLTRSVKSCSVARLPAR